MPFHKKVFREIKRVVRQIEKEDRRFSKKFREESKRIISQTRDVVFPKFPEIPGPDIPAPPPEPDRDQLLREAREETTKKRRRGAAGFAGTILTGSSPLKDVDAFKPSLLGR
jgi:hypothetical protein